MKHENKAKEKADDIELNQWSVHVGGAMAVFAVIAAIASFSAVSHFTTAETKALLLDIGLGSVALVVSSLFLRLVGKSELRRLTK